MRRRTIGEMCVCVCVVVAACGRARAQTDCGSAFAEFQAADSAGWSLTNDQASALADRLLRDLASSPQEPCASHLVDALVVTMGQCGRYGEAAMTAQRALAVEPNPDRRMALANNFVALRLQESGRRLDAAGMQACRAVAIMGLRGSRTPREYLDNGRLDYLATVLPLHHVMASTEPTAQERLAALARLVEMCDASVPVAAAQGRPSPVLLDRYWLIFECARESGCAVDGSGESMASWVRRVPWETDSHRNAGALMMQVVQDKSIPHERRRRCVDVLGPEMPDQGLRGRAAYSLLSESVRALGTSTDEREVAAVYDEVLSVRSLLRDIERASPGGVPAGTAATLWNGQVRTTLYWMWDLGWKRLHRPDAAIAAASDHVQRFPEDSNSREMRRFLANPTVP